MPLDSEPWQARAEIEVSGLVSSARALNKSGGNWVRVDAEPLAGFGHRHVALSGNRDHAARVPSPSYPEKQGCRVVAHTFLLMVTALRTHNPATRLLE